MRAPSRTSGAIVRVVSKSTLDEAHLAALKLANLTKTNTAGVARSVKLMPTQGSVFILLFAVGAIFFSFISGNQWLLAFAGAAGGVLIAAGIFRTDLRGLVVGCTGPARTAAGTSVKHQLLLHNTGRLSLPPFRLTLTSPGLAAGLVHVPGLAPGAQARVELNRIAETRGHQQQAELIAIATDPFQLIARRYGFSMEQDLRVYPAAAPASPWPAGTQRGGGAAAVGGRSATGDPAALRGWRPGDQAGSVHWRSTARRGQLTVLERELPGEPRWMCVLLGTPDGPADEAALATVFATWQQLRRTGHRAVILAWRSPPAGSGESVVDRSPEHLIALQDWFAELRDLAVPHAEQVHRAISVESGLIGNSAVGLTVMAVPLTGAAEFFPQLQAELLARAVRLQPMPADPT